jgi:hypothetical protein
VSNRPRNTPLIMDEYGIGNILERTVEGLDPFQYARELIVNARDAGATEVRIDAYHDQPRDVIAMRFSDNGTGMDETQLVTHSRTLYKSGAGREGNFGQGARLSALATNPLGMAWASRVTSSDGYVAENMVVLDRDDTGMYGLRNFHDSDRGTFHDCVDPEPGMLDQVGSTSGTAVLLYGNGQRNVFSPEIALELRRYIARRFYKLGLNVHVYNPTHGQFNALVDYESQLMRNTGPETRGAVVLDEYGTTALWFLMPPRTERANFASNTRVVSSISVLNQGELFETIDNQSQPGRWGDFGLARASIRTRVSLVIVPGFEIAQKPDRATLNRSLPWEDWANAFYDNMPGPIDALREQRSRSSMTVSEEIKKRLNPKWLEKFAPQLRKVPSTDGDEFAEFELQIAGAALKGTAEAKNGIKPAGPSPRPGQRDLDKLDGQRPARSVKTPTDLQAEFVDDDQWPIPEPQFFVSYNQLRNELLIRKNSSQIQTWMRELSECNPKIARADIEQLVEVRVGLHAVEQIIHILAQDVQGWTPAQIKQALEPAALSAGLLGWSVLEHALRNDVENFRRRKT